MEVSRDGEYKQTLKRVVGVKRNKPTETIKLGAQLALKHQEKQVPKVEKVKKKKIYPCLSAFERDRGGETNEAK